jgi:hypothetical protein
MDSNRLRRGVVTRFSASTWWGRIRLDEGRSLDFHGTSYRGMTVSYSPEVHQRVVVIFSDETRERLLSVEADAPPVPR